MYISKNNDFDVAYRAFKSGAYMTAYTLFANLSTNNDFPIVTDVYKILSFIASQGFKNAQPSVVAKDIEFAVNKVLDSNTNIKELCSLLRGVIVDFDIICKFFKKQYESEDENLKSKYSGSVGISCDSDDDTERYVQQEVNKMIRNANNAVSRERDLLTKQYSDIIFAVFATLVNSIIFNCQVLFNSNKLTLELLCDIDTCTNRWLSDYPKLKELVKTFVSEAKKSRNELYWKEHEEQYENFILEKENCKKAIANILVEQNESANKKIEKANTEIKKCLKEMGRYSLLNFTDRMPLNKKLFSLHEIKKINKKRLIKLKQGVCDKCEPFEKRIKEIDQELSKQR